MLKSLNKKMIDYYEKRGIIPKNRYDSSYESFFIFITSLLFSGIISLVVMGVYSALSIKILGEYLLFDGTQGENFFFISATTMTILFKSYIHFRVQYILVGTIDAIKIYFINYAHFLLPRQEERISEIKAYFEMNPDLLVISRYEHMKEILPTNIEKESLPSYEELPLWIEQYSTSRAFKNLMFRLCEPTKFGLYDASLLKWAKNIPLMSVSENTRLELLKYNKINDPTGELEFVKDVDLLFSNYSEKQIKVLFFSTFKGSYYLSALMKYAKKNEELIPFPIYTRMSLLISFMGDTCENIFPIPELDLEGDCSLGKVIRVGNSSELEQLAMFFSNCAKSHLKGCSKGYYFFYMIKSNTGKDIIFHVDSGFNLLECKYKANNVLSSQDETELKKYLSKYK
jgi:hypothetical protein